MSAHRRGSGACYSHAVGRRLASPEPSISRALASGTDVNGNEHLIQ